MENSHDNDPSNNEKNDSVQDDEKEITRGITIMKKVIRARDKGIRFEVAWNHTNEPVEPNGSMLKSYIGAVVREQVPITCDNWRDKTLNPAKDKIWSEIQRSFIIDDVHKKYLLQVAGKLHRGFRSFLTNKYLKDAHENHIEVCPKIYESLISKEEWKTFVAKRKTKDFQDISTINRERASNPTYPYKKGRLGYARLEQQMLGEEEGCEKTTLPEHVLWKAARVGKDGVVNENVLQVFEDCENLSQSLSQGELQDQTCRNILSKVLDVPEYSGRVRGRGFGVTPTNLYQHPKSKNPSTAQVMDLLQELRSEIHELKKEKERDLSGSSHCNHIPSDKDSINFSFSKKIPEGISPCQLYLSSPTHRMVAKGKVHNIMGDILHHRPLPAGFLKVSVDFALEGDASLPIPDDVADVTLVGQAIGSYVAWPSNLIFLNNETPAKSKANDKEVMRHHESVSSKQENQAPKLQQVSKNKKVEAKQKGDLAKAKLKKPPLSRFRLCLETFVAANMMDGETRAIPMENSIFGFCYEENINKEQMDEIFDHKELGVSIISIYIRYLYDKLVCPRQLTEKFSFLSPHRLSGLLIEKDPNQVKEYIVGVLLDNKDTEKLFFLPYNTGGHWVLIVINPEKEIIYYLDSLHGDHTLHSKMKNMIDTVIQSFQSQRGATVSNTQSNITWIKVQCPRQHNGIDCGYYVLRFMKEIIISNQTEIPRMYFDDFKCLSYSKDKLEEIKEDWSQYMLGLRVI